MMNLNITQAEDLNLDEVRLDRLNYAKHVGHALAIGAAENKTEDALELIQDVYPEIRQTLSFEVRLAENLPQVIVHAIASSDDPDVSGPFLESSPIITERYLLSNLSKLPKHAQTAVARRFDISEPVVEFLVDWGTEKAAINLLRNEHAPLTQALTAKLGERFEDSAKLRLVVSRKKALLGNVVQGAGRKADMTDAKLPFNVLISRARAFQKNGMLNEEFLPKLLEETGVYALEAAFCVMSGLERRQVRAALIKGGAEFVNMASKAGVSKDFYSRHAAVVRNAYALAQNAG